MTAQPHTHDVDVDALFRAHGVHKTAQRKAVWAFFADSLQGHSIPEAVVALRDAGIGQSTVYRTVELFVNMGLLTCVQDAPGKVRYVAMCPGHRHALICRGCQRVVEFNDCDLTVVEKLLAATTGFTIEGHHLEFYGTCPACAPQQPYAHC